jgi:hypothetical protein
LHVLLRIRLISAATLRATSVRKRNVVFILATPRSGSLTVIFGRICDVPLKIASIIVDLYVTGLMLLGPDEKKRDCIAFAGKYKRPFAAGALYAPAR